MPHSNACWLQGTSDGVKGFRVAGVTCAAAAPIIIIITITIIITTLSSS